LKTAGNYKAGQNFVIESSTPAATFGWIRLQATMMGEGDSWKYLMVIKRIISIFISN